MKAPGIIVEKRDGHLVPVSAFDAELLAQQTDRAQFELKPMKARSLPQSRLYWQMLTNVVASTRLGDTYPTAHKLHDALMRDLGFVTVDYDLATGRPYVTRDSSAFDAMGADAFRDYMDRAVARLAEIIGCDPLALSPELSRDEDRLSDPEAFDGGFAENH